MTSRGRGTKLHREHERVVVDLAVERKPPFDPQAVTREFATLAKQNGITHVVTDRHALGWVESAWRTRWTSGVITAHTL